MKFMLVPLMMVGGGAIAMCLASKRSQWVAQNVELGNLVSPSSFDDFETEIRQLVTAGPQLSLGSP